ncbi:MAG: energy transducer TonB [Verrucomicrobiota bacterium]|jgi:outer membrane biosynthesis protein TonB
MTRLQKKCFLFSAGMHGLLAVILVIGSAFRSQPATKDMQILTMIPSKIVDGADAGGGSPEPVAPPQPAAPAAPAVQPPQPAPPAVQPPQPVEPVHPAEMVERPKPREVEREVAPEPSIAKETETKPAHKTHEIHPDYTPASSVTHKKNAKASESATAEAAASSSRAAGRRLRQEIADSLDALASGVKSSGAQGTVVDMPGQGGGEAFAGYATVIYNVYYHAWTTPDSVANKLAEVGAKIVVARDGTIISAEIVKKSSEPALDKSVGRVLRAVTKLPPFPATAHDDQRSFLLLFNLDAKEASG